MQVQWWAYHEVAGTLNPLPYTKEFIWIYCTQRATWWNFHYLIFIFYRFYKFTGEYEESIVLGDKAHKQGIQTGFETQGRHHQNPKTGVSVAPVFQIFSKTD